MLIAALAYTYARRHASDARFVFGTGKLGDLAGFTSAIILAMIALLIGYEAVSRFLAPVPIHFREPFRSRWLDCWSTSSVRGCSQGATITHMATAMGTSTGMKRTATTARPAGS